MRTGISMKSLPTEPELARHAFDTDRLAAYLRAQVCDFRGALSVEPFAGGQSNPTYLITAGERRYVLRRKPSGVLLPAAHAVDREYYVMRALADSGVPVPRVYALCEDTSVVGTPFYVMEFIEGRVLWDPSLPGMTPAQRAAVYDELNRVIAALHGVDYRAAGLADFGKPGNYLTRQIERWTRQYRASETETIEAMERLIEWLPAHRPEGEETALVHGDYRIDNVIFHPSEPRILAVLDWELSTLGHPLVDFAYHCMTWRVSPEEFRGLKGHDLRALGIPQEDAYLAAYCRRTGRDVVPHWDYYLVFNMFRMAAILQGILARSRHGTAASADAAETGKRARLMAEAGWRQAKQLES
ncbi:MAG: phosphotransferase [Pseudomonadota bacterium]|jgi:aminoglycoside phosphotransferase (APT) family kinase protein